MSEVDSSQRRRDEYIPGWGCDNNGARSECDEEEVAADLGIGRRVYVLWVLQGVQDAGLLTPTRLLFEYKDCVEGCIGSQTQLSRCFAARYSIFALDFATPYIS